MRPLTCLPLEDLLSAKIAGTVFPHAINRKAMSRFYGTTQSLQRRDLNSRRAAYEAVLGPNSSLLCISDTIVSHLKLLV